MSATFGKDYAAAYDALYAEKDYDAECDLLEEIFNASGRRVRTVLDLGCGTGAHSLRLAERGYDVVGVDLSSAMLAIARSRIGSGGSGRVEFVEGDVRSVRLADRFDAVICMFAVLGYQTTDVDVRQTLDTVRHHLIEAGSFAFDVWYGPAVESIGPSTRIRQVTSGDSEFERHASAELRREAHLCSVTYRLIKHRTGSPDEVADEIHTMRYFFRDELEVLLRNSRLELRTLTPFPDDGKPLSDETWNVLAVAGG